MISLKKRSQGFTIVELLIVIVVIGILAALVVTTYSGIQAKGRDAQRQSDLQSLQTQIEAYYATNNFYPSVGNLNAQAFRDASMKSLDKGALYDPSGDESSTTPLSNATATATGKKYGYVALESDGTTACSGTGTTNDTNCAQYTLSAYLETTKANYTKANLD